MSSAKKAVSKQRQIDVVSAEIGFVLPDDPLHEAFAKIAFENILAMLEPKKSTGERPTQKWKQKKT